MGIGKYALFGFGGFMAMGLLVLPFIPEPTPEQDLASGQRYFANQCNSLTRNRKINGSFGKGHLYCQCLSDRVSEVAQSGDEYRFAERVIDTVGSERWFLVKSRAKFDMNVGIRQFQDKIDHARMSEIFHAVVDRAKSCIHAV